MNTPLRIGIVEDQPHMRQHLRQVLGRAQDMELAYEYRSAEEAFPAVIDHGLDVLVSDIGLPAAPAASTS